MQETSAKSQYLVNWSLLERRVTKLFKRIANSSTLLGLFIIIGILTKKDITNINLVNVHVFICKYFFSDISNNFKFIFIFLFMFKNLTKFFVIFISGTLDPLEKKTIVRKKPEQRVVLQAAMRVPDKLMPHGNTKDEDSVERTVRKIKKLITCYCKETEKPLDFFQLILHPHDFGKTIRNMLYISFLVKDGVVKLKKGVFLSFLIFFILSTSSPVIFFLSYYQNLIIIFISDHRNLIVEPCLKEINIQEKQINKMGIQNVTSLNMKQWRVS